MTSLSNKVALLTGTLGSLGQAQAEALAKAGASVVLWDRPGRAEGDAFAEALAQKHGARARYVGADLDDLAASETVRGR
jgi:NAD(P)-dependent dehydrogenase (short-subunit alcohol dehydrogenase family)